MLVCVGAQAMTVYAYQVVEGIDEANLASCLRDYGNDGWRLHTAFKVEARYTIEYTLIFEQSRQPRIREKRLRAPDQRGIKAIDDFEGMSDD